MGMSENMQWWGYIHANSTAHVKRYFPHTGEQDIKDAKESPFCMEVFGPFEADCKKDAFDAMYNLHVISGHLCINCWNPIEEGQAGELCIECGDK